MEEERLAFYFTQVDWTDVFVDPKIWSDFLVQYETSVADSVVLFQGKKHVVHVDEELLFVVFQLRRTEVARVLNRPQFLRSRRHVFKVYFFH